MTKGNRRAKLTNFFPLSRKIFNHALWMEGREFSRFEAWIYLLTNARYEKDGKTLIIQGVPVLIGRGEICASIRFLSGVWNWSKGKVERFLIYLEREGMITKGINNRQTILLICNYDRYNGFGEFGGDSDERNETPTGTVAEVWKESTDNGLQDANIKKRDRKSATCERPIGALAEATTGARNETRPLISEIATDNGLQEPLWEKWDGIQDAMRDRDDDDHEDNNIKKVKEVKKERYGATNVAHTPQQLDSFAKFQAFILEEARDVAKMERPFTIEQYFKLFADFPGPENRELILDVIRAMDNDKKLLKERKDANRTCRNWIAMRQKWGVGATKANSETKKEMVL